MDRFYSLTLGAAIVLAAGSLAVLVASALGAWNPRLAAAVRRGSGLAARASLVLVAASAGVHLAAGHRPGTSQELGALAFAREHPAVLVVVVLASLAWWSASRAGSGENGSG